MLISIVVILAPIIIQYYYKHKNKSENENELQVIHQKFNLMSEKNPGYEATDINTTYEEEIFSLPQIDVDQIQKGKLIGNKS